MIVVVDLVLKYDEMFVENVYLIKHIFNNLLSEFSIFFQRIISFDAILKLAQSGDAPARKAIEKMCAALGRGLRMIASALAPNEIVVVGDITTVWYLVGPVVEAEMQRSPLGKVPHVRPAQDGGKARLRSAVALVMNDNLL